MPNDPSAPSLAKVPYEGLWLDGFSLTGAPVGALLAGGQAWQRDGIGATPRPTADASYWERATRRWHSLPAMPQPRQDHAAVTLPDGRVLLLGGKSPDAFELSTTLLWEPGDRRFHEGPPLRAARARPVAVTLADGTVLVLGSDFDEDLARGTRAEVLWPGASQWEPAGQTARLFHPGPVCVSGERVLIAGGRDNGMGFAIIEGVHFAPPLDQMTEVWERGSRTWKTLGALNRSRDEATGVTLSDGRVLVVGGWDRGKTLATAEVWDPSTGEWSETGPVHLPRSSFALTALPGGGAALSGGLAEDTSAETDSVELWTPAQGTWSPGPRLAVGRAGHRLVEVERGTFLVVGSTRDAQGELATTWEVWSPLG